MAKEMVEVEVEKATLELLQGVAKLVGLIKVAHAAGGGAVVEIGADISSAVVVLGPLISSVSSLGGEFKEDHAAFANAIALGSIDLVKAIAG